MGKGQDIKSFILRVDTQTMDALESWAQEEYRSTNGQLQWIIADALKRCGRTPGARKKKAVSQPET